MLENGFLQLSQKRDTQGIFSFQLVSTCRTCHSQVPSVLSAEFTAPVSPGVVKTLGKHGQGKSRVQLQHELLDAAKGALDRSCHLVSSFGSESQLTADPACLAGANVSLSRPPQPALLLHAHLNTPMQGEG